MYQNYVIIVGGGSGNRMQSNTPKQFIPLHGMPVLMHTINSFANSIAQPKILLVLNESMHEYWKELCLKFKFIVEHELIKGGTTRFHSVKNALLHLNERLASLENVLIAVHDAVRPLVSNSIITDAYQAAQKHQCVVVAIPCTDSVRLKVSEYEIDPLDLVETKALDRNQVFLVQTPQVFHATVLFSAYQAEYTDNFTDDASVVEYSGYPIKLVNGSTRNIKITYPQDISIAEILISTE